MATQQITPISLRTHLLVSFVVTAVLATLLLLGHYAFGFGRGTKLAILCGGFVSGIWFLLVLMVVFAPVGQAQSDAPRPRRAWFLDPFDW